jgi:hypothetical protein
MFNMNFKFLTGMSSYLTLIIRDAVGRMDLGCGMYFFWLLRSKSPICELQMASYRASIRSQQNSQLHVQLPPLSGRDSTPVAAQSLMAGFGRMTRINTSVWRSSFTSHLQTPLLSPSPLPVEVESIPAMSPEERTWRDLEQDRKDAERELQRYEDSRDS